MGFHSLRHVGTADHLHVSLRLPDSPPDTLTVDAAQVDKPQTAPPRPNSSETSEAGTTGIVQESPQEAVPSYIFTRLNRGNRPRNHLGRGGRR